MARQQSHRRLFPTRAIEAVNLAPETVLFARRYRLLPHTSTKGLSSVEIAALCVAARNLIDEAGARLEDRKPAQNHPLRPLVRVPAGNE